MCTSDSIKWKLAMNAGERALLELVQIENSTPTLMLDNPSYKHHKSFVNLETSRNLSRRAYVKENALKYLFRNGNLTENCISSTVEPMHIEDIMTCNRYQRFRSYDGTCNNLEHPQKFGVHLRPFRRALPPDYADGISAPRVSKSGVELPSARLVSVTVHRPIYKNDDKFTVMLAVWGQFIDHDITATAISTKSDGDTISCCANHTHPQCFPVPIDSHDAYYSVRNVTCMEFVRSSPAPADSLGPRQQLNQATSFLDGSVVYGPNENITKSLREFKDGLLKMYVTLKNRTLLPLSTNPSDGCNTQQQNKLGRYCFMTGDQRANENLLLTSLHLIWARQHNAIASQLKSLNQHWKDERIFLETRHIIGAQLQHITFKEFLPAVIGSKLAEKLNLTPKSKGYYYGYDQNIDASIANNFATATFRFGHTLIPSLIKFLGNDTRNPEYVQLHRMLFNPYELYRDEGLDDGLRGAMNTSIEASDTYFSSEVKGHLFENPNQAFCGLDLVSLNIQRGRDHGLPGYVKWRQHCDLQYVNNFDDLSEDIDSDSLTNIHAVYKHVNDIDLYTGAISEKPLKDGLLGPTFTCLIVDQFIRLKRGDRMWYENPGVFTESQLDEIRQTSLAQVLCDNSDSVDHVQVEVMQRVGNNNKYVPCVDLVKPDLTKWQEGKLAHLHVVSNPLYVSTYPLVN